MRPASPSALRTKQCSQQADCRMPTTVGKFSGHCTLLPLRCSFHCNQKSFPSVPLLLVYVLQTQTVVDILLIQAGLTCGRTAAAGPALLLKLSGHALTAPSPPPGTAALGGARGKSRWWGGRWPPGSHTACPAGAPAQSREGAVRQASCVTEQGRLCGRAGQAAHAHKRSVGHPATCQRGRSHQAPALTLNQLLPGSGRKCERPMT